jgi:hypothetical protein
LFIIASLDKYNLGQNKKMELINMKNKEQDIRIDIDFCEVCLDDKHYIIKEEEKTDYARGKEIKYTRKQAYCTECNSPMYISKLNDENLDVLYSKIR